MTKPILDVLPVSLAHCVKDLLTDAEELRLRIGQIPTVTKNGREYCVSSFQCIEKCDFDHILASASHSSAYAVNDTLRQGFLTLQGGHRIGFCGEVIQESGAVKSFRHISSMVFRIAKEWYGIGIAPEKSTLIIGPPGAGKTTLLRDCIRLLSDECMQKVCLLDERGEVAASHEGVPQFHVGKRTDVLTGCKKEIGLDMLLRTMSPQWIALDEITQESDILSLCRASYCGVRILATAHARNREDLLRRPVYRLLSKSGVFDCLMTLRMDHHYATEEMGST